MSEKKSNATRRILLYIAVLVVVLVVGGVAGKALGWFGGSDEGIVVETAFADIRDVTQVVTASGRVQPEVEVRISPDVPGEITYLGVREGQHVEKGMLLIRIRPDFYEAQFDQARAGVSLAKAGLARAEADLLLAQLNMERTRELHERNVIPQREYDTAVTNLDISKANLDAAGYQVESAEAKKSEAEENLAKTRIYSPMTGTVSMLNVELGERVVGTAQMTGTEMLRIARLDQMEVEAEVNENDVVNISLNDTARIEVDAYPDRAFKGIVTEIANSARIAAQGTQEQVTNFPVKVRILDHHGDGSGSGNSSRVGSDEVSIPTNQLPDFRPGMSSSVDIFTDYVPDCVTVPIQAVTVRDVNRTKPEEEEDSEYVAGVSKEEDLRRVVFVVREGSAEMVEVETGISNDTHIQIVSGITEGEEVVSGPYSAISRTLTSGDKVRIRDER